MEDEERRRGRGRVQTSEFRLRDHFKGLRSPAVLVVADLFHPIDRLAVELFLNGNVRHGRGWRGAMPMLLARREPDHVTRPDFLDRAAPALHPDRSQPSRSASGPADGCAMRFERRART